MKVRPEIGATRLPHGVGGTGSTPYRRPIIKEPVWTWEIPVYFYAGGLAGASAGLAVLSDARGEHALARRAWATAFAGSIVSPALLISDLGVPRRFLYMLRMFKVTSPMSVGSWLLVGFGTATAAATAHAWTGGRGGRAGRAAQFASAVLGLPLASYTAMLVANTSVPAWHEARHDLPFVFVSGAAMSAGAAAVALAPREEAAAARRLAVGGAVAELVVTQMMERRLERARVAAGYHEGRAGVITRVAKGLTVAGGAIVAARAGRSRRAAVAGGVLLSAAAVAERWAVFEAGRQSAARPQDTADTQRAAIVRGEAPGSSRKQPHAGAAGLASGRD
jgi:hypothetical protein